MFNGRRGGRMSCKVEECIGTARSKGLCNSHAHRLRRYGDPLAGGPYRDNLSHAQRFWARVDGSGDCWLWTGPMHSRGYGTMSVYVGYGTTRSQYAHRLAWEFLVGPIPKGLNIDHLCKNKLCVNPDHLEPVTQRVNVRRGITAKKTHCKWGHLLQGANLYIRPDTGTRVCRRCSQDRSRARRLVVL